MADKQKSAPRSRQTSRSYSLRRAERLAEALGLVASGRKGMDPVTGFVSRFWCVTEERDGPPLPGDRFVFLRDMIEALEVRLARNRPDDPLLWPQGMRRTMILRALKNDAGKTPRVGAVHRPGP